MLVSFTAGMEYPRGDVDQNGVVDITDVVTLIDYLLNETWPDEPSPASDMTFTVNGVSFTMVAVEGGLSRWARQENRALALTIGRDLSTK